MDVYHDWRVPRLAITPVHTTIYSPPSVALLLLGHGYMILLVMVCQTAVYREVTALFSIKAIDGEESPQERDPWSKTLNWYFFAVANYYLYGESIIYYFKVGDHQTAFIRV